MTTAQKRDATSVLRIEGEMTIYRAAELKQTLLASLDLAEELEVDLAAVTELDTAGVQILILAKQQALARQRKLRLIAHSPAVLDVLELLNLAAYFGDPLVIPSRFAAGRA
ncbi:MAG: STAS domain-containing protein [Oxalobacteraceae bacterium]|nr:STAS domain-containing protein [Oxalobacteraceae bacterium]